MNTYTLNELSEDDCQPIPQKPGIYWYEIDAPIKKAEFKHDNPSCHLKGDPTVAEEILGPKWVPDATILYIGKTTNLRHRFRARARFAIGEPTRAWGGRYLWQLDDIIQEKMLIHYEIVPGHEKMTREELKDTLEKMERAEIERFKKKFGRLPFANLR